ncbi:MAG: PAS domain S-box protein, partial [Kofleriaceae bacterium]
MIERECRFATILHEVSDVVVTVDVAGTITFLNTAAERLTGSGSEALGRPVREVVRLVDEHHFAVAS